MIEGKRSEDGVSLHPLKTGERLMPNVVDSLMSKAAQISGPIDDAKALVELAAFLLETSIEVIPVPEFPPGAPSAAIRRPNQTFRILYRPSPCFLFTQICILHELAHILLHHCETTAMDLFEDRTIYTDQEEWEAEQFAHQMMSFMLRTGPSEHRVSARFQSLLPTKPQVALKGYNPQSTLRFEALLPSLRNRR